MPALELVSGFATAPGAVITAIDMCAGNTLTIRNCALNSDIFLLSAWQSKQAAGICRIRSPKLHDNVQCMRAQAQALNGQVFIPPSYKQKLYPQDDLIVELDGSAAVGDLELVSLLIYYQDLPGANGNYATWDSIKNNIKNILTVENTLTLGATGDYTGEEAINAEFDLLKANTNYAILGATFDELCGAIRYRGVDFANMGVGLPTNSYEGQRFSQWFKYLSEESGLATIPIFNSANKDGLLIDGQQDENAAAVTVTTILAEL